MLESRRVRWETQSKAEERRTPERFMSSYELTIDPQHVWMDENTYSALVANCGRFDATNPGPALQFRGLAWISGGKLKWFDVADDDDAEAEDFLAIESRIILVKTGHGPTRRVH